MNDFKDQDPIFQRLRNADPAATTPAVNARVVAAAPLAKGVKPALSWKLRRNFFSGAGVVTASVAVLALAVGLQQQPLIKLGSSSSVGSASGVAEAQDDRAMSFVPFSYEYLAGAGLSNDGGRGSVWQLELVGEPRERLADLANRFGLTGELTRDDWSTAETPSFSISEETKYLSIYWGGTGGWSFSSWDAAPVCSEPAVDPGVEPEAPESSEQTPDPRTDDEGDSTDASDPEGSNSEVSDPGAAETSDEVTASPDRGSCDWALEPTPELIPSSAEITSQALDLFAATGLTVSASDLRIYRDEWGASASAALKVDGEATGIEWYVGWNSVGELSYASGHSVQAINRGEFDTISPVAAVQRLGDWRWYGSVASEIYEEIYGGGLERGIAVPAETAPEDAGAEPPVELNPSESGADEAPAEEKPTEDTPVAEPGFDIMPVYPEGEAQVVTLTVDASRPALLTIYDAAGSAWLVPGYLMFNSEGFFDAVIALEDGVIELPEPLDDDIMPLPADLGRDNLVD